MNQTEDQSLEDSGVSDNSEVMLRRNMVFSTALYCQNPECQKKKKNRERFLQDFKKKKKKKTQISTYTASQYNLGTKEGNLTIKGVPALASRKGSV